jgi:hypothetical protein
MEITVSTTSATQALPLNQITWGPLTIGSIDAVLLPGGFLDMHTNPPSYHPYDFPDDSID